MDTQLDTQMDTQLDTERYKSLSESDDEIPVDIYEEIPPIGEGDAPNVDASGAIIVGGAVGGVLVGVVKKPFVMNWRNKRYEEAFYDIKREMNPTYFSGSVPVKVAFEEVRRRMV